MATFSLFAAPGAALLLTLASGFWLSRLTKPLSPFLFNVHKLLAVAAIILVVIQAMNGIPYSGSRMSLIAFGAACAFCVLALFATGALMSAVVGNYDLWHNIHRAATLLLVGLISAAVYFLFR